jgi:hypothetical protein
MSTKTRKSGKRTKDEEALPSLPLSTSILLEEKLKKYFASKSTLELIHPFDDAHTSYRYSIIDAYKGKTPYWIDNLRGEQFEWIQTNGILYRPTIVYEIIQAIESNLRTDVGKGLFVKGPQNIGKSSSLVNTVVYLETSGDYLVTFIPDCEKWNTTFDLVKAIFKSFNVDVDELGHSEVDMNDMNSDSDVEDLIEEINYILAQLDKKWIFVFNNIHKIVDRPQCSYTRGSVGSLPLPFSLMKHVMKANRITSIISAPANHESAIKYNNEGFVEYNHKTNMDKQEVQLVFSGSLGRCDIETVMKITGGVPGYVHSLLNIYNGNVDEFEKEVGSQLKNSIGNHQKMSMNAIWRPIK